MKTVLNISQWAAAILVSLLILTMSISYYAYNENLYMKLYLKNDVPAATGMDEENLKHVTSGLVSYMKGNTPSLDMEATIRGEVREVFNKREKDHMVDVLKLFQLSDSIKGVLLGTVMFIIGISVWRGVPEFAIKIGFNQAIVSLILAGGMLIVSLTNFSAAFIRFHKIFFTNDLWILDPRTDTLIQMLPEPFFKSMAMMMFGTWFVISLVIGVASYMFRDLRVNA